MALVTFTRAVEHLHLSIVEESPPSEAELDLRLKMEQATNLVIDYVKKRDHPWRDSTDPMVDPEFAIVQGAILKVLGCLWRERGDGEKPYDPIAEIELMMSGYRKPTLA